MTERSRRVYFQHLQKTAGTSLADTLRLFFPPERTATTERYLQESTENAAAASDRYDFVTGHWEVLSRAPTGVFKIAVFRDPLTRLLSARRQVVQAGPENIAAAPPEEADAIVALQRKPIADVLRLVPNHRVMVVGFWNHQSIVLGGWPLLRADNPSLAPSTSMHEYFATGPEFLSWLVHNKARIAKRALRSLQALDYVGLTEDFDNSVREIFARLGLPEPRDVVVRNARPLIGDENDPQIPEISKEFIDLDGELYEAATERHAVLRRVARGMPVDYIGHALSAKEAVVISAGDAPCGHGWHQRHERPEGIWGRWTGPGLESRVALSAPAGVYSIELEMFGASPGTDASAMRIEIEGEQLPTALAQAPNNLWVASAQFERIRSGAFDVVLRFPEGTPDEGVSVKQIVFAPVVKPSAADAASEEEIS